MQQKCIDCCSAIPIQNEHGYYHNPSLDLQEKSNSRPSQQFSLLYPSLRTHLSSPKGSQALQLIRNSHNHYRRDQSSWEYYPCNSGETLVHQRWHRSSFVMVVDCRCLCCRVVLLVLVPCAAMPGWLLPPVDCYSASPRSPPATFTAHSATALSRHAYFVHCNHSNHHPPFYPNCYR